MDEEVIRLIEQAAALWRISKKRPSPAANVLDNWDRLLNDWVADDSMPLLIRKGGLSRGQVVQHKSGRTLVPTDNTPAHWSLSLTLDGVVPSLDECRAQLESGALGVALAFKGDERKQAAYHGILKKYKNLTKWRICHIEPVSDASKTPLPERNIADLLEHSKRFLRPRNMFVVSRSSGLGEVGAFIRAFADENATPTQ